MALSSSILGAGPLLLVRTYKPVRCGVNGAAARQQPVSYSVVSVARLNIARLGRHYSSYVKFRLRMHPPTRNPRNPEHWTDYFVAS